MRCSRGTRCSFVPAHLARSTTSCCLRRWSGSRPTTSDVAARTPGRNRIHDNSSHQKVNHILSHLSPSRLWLTRPGPLLHLRHGSTRVVTNTVVVDQRMSVSLPHDISSNNQNIAA